MKTIFLYLVCFVVGVIALLFWRDHWQENETPPPIK